MNDSYNRIPRGIRNNNPLNLRKTTNPWLGKIVPGSDPAFEQFTSPVFGIRAAMVNARTLIKRNKKLTIEQLIRIWAPPSENDTSAYISKVCQLACKLPHEEVKVRNREDFVRIIHAMAYVENGQLLQLSYFYSAYDMLYEQPTKKY